MKTQTFTASDGQQIICSLWDRVTGAPRGVVQIIHGMDEHVGRYDRFAKFLNKNGYIVWGDDHRAHGRTAGRAEHVGRPMGDADLFASTVADELEILEYLRGRFNLPVILFGHSYGSFITQSVISQTSRHSGVILSGTARYPRALVRMAYWAAAVGTWISGPNASARFLELFSPIRSRPGRPSKLTRDPAQVAAHDRDPWRTKYFSYGFYKSLFKNLLRLRYAANPDIPMLILAGDADAVGGHGKYAFKLYETYVMRVRNTSLYIYPDARHELLLELNYADVQDDALKFINTARQNACHINRCEITLNLKS